MKYFQISLIAILLVFGAALSGQGPGVLNTPIDISGFPPLSKLDTDASCFNLTIFVDRSVVDSVGQDVGEALVNRTVLEFLPAYDSIDIPVEVEIQYLDTRWVGTDYQLYLRTAELTDWGDAMLLFTLETLNGIAAVDALGTQYARGVCGLHLHDAPAYTGRFWNKMVTAHELGHIIRAQHTHTSVWNGNNTPIDSCGYGIRPPANSTIMSYCHFYGMTEFRFANQVGDTLNVGINEAGLDCPVDGCDTTRYARIVLNDYPTETTWRWGESVGGPYPKDSVDTYIQACAKQCDTLFIFDSAGDGLVGSCQQGYVIVDGISYTFTGDSLAINFCAPPTVIPCVDISSPTIYTPQIRPNRVGTYSSSGGVTTLQGNGWWSIEIDYIATENSFIRLDVLGDGQGEIQGVAISDTYNPLAQTRYNLFGTQIYGADRSIRPEVGVWKTLEIPLTSGQKNYLWLINDKDQGHNKCEISFKDICIAESGNSTSKENSTYYNILGQQVVPTKPGVYIKGGKKVIFMPE